MENIKGQINKCLEYHTDAYAVAVANGFKGTVEEWLASLVGPQGAKGEKGDPGYTPQKGVDYYAEAEKEEIVNETYAKLEPHLGDIETALDGIIAIQDGLMGA